jgi:hypothetical protein
MCGETVFGAELRLTAEETQFLWTGTLAVITAIAIFAVVTRTGLVGFEPSAARSAFFLTRTLSACGPLF